MMQSQQAFDVLRVDLQGCNLIEASAGTGKTYSIGILTLRLLLEKKIPINEILMVTFTDAAVEELRERIRKFVREAYDMCNNPSSIDDGHIGLLVKEALDRNEETCKQLLRDALALIDETAILTIHGFCNRTLSEFAFETSSLFEKEVVSDLDDLVEQSANVFWRKNITTRSTEELSILLEYGLSKTTLMQVCKEVLNGKIFLSEEFEDKDWLTAFKNLENELSQKEDTYVTSYNSYADEINKEIEGIKGKAAHKHFLSAYGNAELMLEKYSEKTSKPPKYFASLPQEFVDPILEVQEAQEQIENLLTTVISDIYSQAFDFIKTDLVRRKEEKAIQSFDDLINNLHSVITSDRKEKLVESLNKKYKAVFIDEFQDTDKVQYEIFYEAFRTNSDSILFYIGDPKQSIYAFRKADLETYKKSKLGSNIFTMSTNFRSTPEYVDAMNLFFKSDANFFADDEIQYIEVNAPESAQQFGAITKEGTKTAPLEFIAAAIADDAIQAVCDTCLDLLATHEIKDRKVMPSDIGILTSSKNDGAKIKRSLNTKGIPAVVVDDTKVIETEEAKHVQYILEAILHHDRSAIIKALLTPLFSTSVEEIEKLDIAIEQQRFQKALKVYEQSGAYASIISVIDQYNVKGLLLSDEEKNAPRTLSNIYQLAELCQKRALENNYDLEKLISWLNRERLNAHDSKEGYELRLESDEEAVKIVTIHKSKGLDYNIVITQSMQLQSAPHSKSETLTVQNEETTDYEFTLDVKNEELVERYKSQKEKENRRLMYVTLTRARYKSFVVTNEWKKDTHLYTILPALKAKETPLFSFSTWEEQELPRYRQQEVVLDQEVASAKNIKEFKNSWSLLSYSMISKHGEHFVPEVFETEPNEYDEFVFENLPRGASLGNFLHYLFENIDFQNEATFMRWIENGEYLFGKRIVKEELKPFYKQLIEQVLASQLNYNDQSFNLTDISTPSRLNEMQFYFSIDEFSKADLKKFEKPVDMDFHKYEGFFQGFIDLTFEHKGKYYILDWKSNYLGNGLEAYTPEALDKAMTVNNYHLQYFIYSIALVRYLKKVIPNFSYEKHFGGAFYIFLRGCRAGSNTGVFHHKVSWESLSKHLK